MPDVTLHGITVGYDSAKLFFFRVNMYSFSVVAIATTYPLVLHHIF